MNKIRTTSTTWTWKTGAPTWSNSNYGTLIITEREATRTRTVQHTYQQKCTSAPPLQHEEVDKLNRDRVE